MMEATEGIGQKSRKVGTKDCLLFDNWFDSKKTEESALEVDAKLIGMLKKNTKGLYKDNSKSFTKDWPGVFTSC